LTNGTNTARFELSSHVLHESIDGEVIAIDQSTGIYYSLRGSAAEVWGLVQRSPGVAPAEVAEALAHYYDPAGVDVEAAVSLFFGTLHEEGLVTVKDGVGPTALVPALGANGARGSTFASPVLEKYTDMQDLVLIDPVHEVTEGGWPHTRPDATAVAS
jgi:Coenzyme PQQ synthesis protein D (PqqD)